MEHITLTIYMIVTIGERCRGVKCNCSQIRSNARQEDNYHGLSRTTEISKTWD